MKSDVKQTWMKNTACELLEVSKLEHKSHSGLMKNMAIFLLNISSLHLPPSICEYLHIHHVLKGFIQLLHWMKQWSSFPKKSNFHPQSSFNESQFYVQQRTFFAVAVQFQFEAYSILIVDGYKV